MKIHYFKIYSDRIVNWEISILLIFLSVKKYVKKVAKFDIVFLFGMTQNHFAIAVNSLYPISEYRKILQDNIC